MKTTAYLSLGSNLGNKQLNLETACRMLEAEDIRITAASSVYITEPWGNTPQDDFLNQVLEVETTLQAEQLLTVIQNIEKRMGRVRSEHWGPRLIDIDIILFGEQVISSRNLTVPHPYLEQRAFVLIPLLEIAPEIHLPGAGNLQETLDNLAKNAKIGCIKKVTYDKMNQR
ncbi:MAG: 2-amino-4-hydroxy-6-hydroxymethyldihydropteridine diphosphokinase [Syntrophothermaceae bacterium]|jgi:2-amino-4-hydroxy-6-hydroxymethyldihydropteridine diphosphokinase